MDNFFVRNRLSAYLDGDLPPSEAREVEAAISRDPALRAEYDALRQAVQLLREHGPLKAPAGFARRLDERLAAEPAPAAWRAWFRRARPEVYAIAAVAVLALWYVGQPTPTSPIAAVPTATPAVAPPTAGEEAPELGTPPAIDGVLGEEGFAAAREDAQKKRAAAPQGVSTGKIRAPTSKEAIEKEAYAPAWEADPSMTVIRGEEIVQQAKEPAKTKSLYSPPPFRYRVRSGDEKNLQQLGAVVTSLGGRMVDEQGRTVVLHLLEQGEVRSIRIVLPSEKVEQLTAALGGLGDVETMAADRSLLYEAGASVPVQVELERE